MDGLVEDFRGRGRRRLPVRAAAIHVPRRRQRDDGHVASIRNVDDSDLWINGGHFILRPYVFDYMEPGDELVERPFERLIEAGQLITYRHDGFWAPMDTLKDMQTLEALYEGGDPPWTLWRSSPGLA